MASSSAGGRDAITPASGLSNKGSADMGQTDSVRAPDAPHDRGGRRKRDDGDQPATAASACLAGMNRSTSSRVFWILPRLEAPNTIDSMLGCSAIHWIASFGGMAPEANTDIATARKRRFSRALA